MQIYNFETKDKANKLFELLNRNFSKTEKATDTAGVSVAKDACSTLSYIKQTGERRNNIGIIPILFYTDMAMGENVNIKKIQFRNGLYVCLHTVFSKY